jgi:phage shock protein PspC (stress-responsive transcriptional regulator)/branched-subunit amino acid transport protein AzlD
MTQDSPNPADAPPNPTQDPGASTSGRYDLRTLRRSRDDRMIGGVCGGLGRYTRVDPIIFRIVLAALAIFGGVGLLLYALAWLLMPEEGTDTSELHRLFKGHASPWPIIAAAVIGFLGIVTFADVVHHRPGGQFAVLLIVIAVVAVIAIKRRATDTRPQYAGQALYTPPPPYAPPMYTPPVYTPPPYTAPLGPPAGFAPSRPVYTPPPGYVPPPPKQRRPPSILGPLAISVGIVVIGVLFALDASHTINISAQAVLAAGLLTLGIALVIAAWIGRARALIAVGVILTVALAVTAALDVPLRGGMGTRNDAPLAVTDLPAAYHLGIGNQTIDLTQLKTGGKTVHIAANVGFGQLRIFVPGDAVVKAHGRVGAGDLRLLGAITNGTHLNRTVVVEPNGPTVAAAGELDLDLRVGVGDVEVLQFATPGGVSQ